MKVLEKYHPTRGVPNVIYVARFIKMNIVSDFLFQDTQDKNHISVLIVTNVSDYLDVELFSREHTLEKRPTSVSCAASALQIHFIAKDTREHTLEKNP